MPPRLAKYFEERPNGTWEQFSRRKKNRTTVFNVLCDMQYGLCAYCEINITDYDRQVEHFFPKSASVDSTNKHLEWKNMLLCCKGGNLEGETRVTTHQLQLERRILNTDTYSCGKLKGDFVFDERLNPYNWEFSLVRMQTIPLGETYDGEESLAYELRLVPWEEHCKYAGIAPTEVKKFIDALNINGERLLKARSEAYQYRLKIAHETPEDRMHSCICDYLLPQSSRLPRFVSVSSSVFKTRGSILVLRHTLLEILNHIKNNKKKS